MKSEKLSVKLAPQRKPFTDVVGLELGSGRSSGVPAVRLRKREGKTELLAAGFLDLPAAVPENEEAAKAAVLWQLPRAFQAPYAALAISSPLSFLRHSAGTGEETAERKQLPYRQTSRVIAADLPPLTAGLPEFQAAWAARLLPEGRYPTACSIQLSAAAAMSGFTASETFRKAEGNAIALFVFPAFTSLAAFQETRLVLYREHPVGADTIRNAISDQMRIEIGLSDAVLEDTLIDPTPMIEPVLRPLFRQVEISADYLLRRRNCPVQSFFVSGLTAGTRYWSTVFSHMMSQPLISCLPLEGVPHAAKNTNVMADLKASAPLLMAAAGAASAVLEDV